MHAPIFVPYLGRKSCPLGLPLAPAIMGAVNPGQALASRARIGPEAAFHDRWTENQGVPMVARDAWDGEANGPLVQRTETRRDQPRSRRLWQFDLRPEIIEGLPAAEDAP